MTDEEAIHQELQMEDLLHFALGERRDAVRLVDVAPLIHTAVAPTRRPRVSRLMMPNIVPDTPLGDVGHLTLKVPGELVAMIHGEPKDRDVLLLVHIERDVLDSWLLRRQLSEGVAS